MPGRRSRSRSVRSEPLRVAATDCNVLFLRTEQGILGARIARPFVHLVLAKIFEPQEVKSCNLLSVEPQFKLFVRLLTWLGRPLKELRTALHIQPADAEASITFDLDREVPSLSHSSFLELHARWDELSLKYFEMTLNAHLPNDRRSKPPRRCTFIGHRIDEKYPIKYRFETSDGRAHWKELRERSTDDDVWSVIERALEDLSSPSHHPHGHIHLGERNYISAHMSFESFLASKPNDVSLATG
jgi:hypothetical protein